MKTINAPILASLAKQNSRIVYAALLTRVDGTKYGFIEHDKPITIDSVAYQPQQGMESSTTKTSADGTPSHQTFVGYLSSPDISDKDIRAGLFEDASLQIFLVDLDNPPATVTAGDIIMVGKFFLGEFKMIDGVFHAEVVSLAAKLKTPVVEVTSPTCRAIFGDSKCKFDLNSQTITTTITSMPDPLSVTVAADISSLRMQYGYAEFVTGSLAGYRMDIIDATGPNGLKLFMPFEHDDQTGETVKVVGGCDKTFETCQVYNNVVNFQGEPNLPGSDKWKSGAKQVL